MKLTLNEQDRKKSLDRDKHLHDLCIHFMHQIYHFW